MQSTLGTICSFWLQIGPLLSWFNARWHFKSINWDGRQTSLNVAALPRLERKKKRKIHPSCNLAPSSSPLWQGGSDKSSFFFFFFSFAWAIRKRQRTWGRTAKRSITKHTAAKPALRSTQSWAGLERENKMFVFIAQIQKHCFFSRIEVLKH